MHRSGCRRGIEVPVNVLTKTTDFAGVALPGLGKESGCEQTAPADGYEEFTIVGDASLPINYKSEIVKKTKMRLDL